MKRTPIVPLALVLVVFIGVMLVGAAVAKLMVDNIKPPKTETPILIEEGEKVDETQIVIEQNTCLEDIKKYEEETQARIDAATVIEQNKNSSRVAFAKGDVVMLEDGGFYSKYRPDEMFCIPLTACDDEHEEAWVPQSLFVADWTWEE